ncbi:MAG: hypothetical protein HPY61_07460 [Methanotrichaceae archaeon]|nr:hypothetical protein [Methanotrichaceae archaeon]
MLNFAGLTGLSTALPHCRRYLWTDAFAVCNYLELFRQTSERAYLDLALKLVDQVHHTLGQHRQDDPRSGWISGLGEKEGTLHPTIGGLRIGKKLNERKAEEAADERLEWDQDGQYYHYLTKWMHALNCVSRVTSDPTYTRWAMELARIAHARFTYEPPQGGQKRMRWKMSIDLTRPLVSSMGQHDPLDGFVTYHELQEAGRRDFGKSPPLDLKPEIVDISEICRGIFLATNDPLGTGGLLFDGCRIAQLMAEGRLKDPALLRAVLDSAARGMESFVTGDSLLHPAEYRLAFRELGLSIGLSAVVKVQEVMKRNPGTFGQGNDLPGLVKDLTDYLPLREKIEQFWMTDRNRLSATWRDHREINMVMLATSLAPESFLRI